MCICVVPLYVCLSKLVTGFFHVTVCSELPVQGIVLVMGNDIAGGKVSPALEVLDSPVVDDHLQ